jgi:V/A-type H+-transporting ATPase subunit C
MSKKGIDLDYNILFGDWKWGNDPRYAYATGLIRSMELRLIPPDRFLRLADARGSGEIFSMLGDTDYSKTHHEDIGGLYAHDIDLILSEEEERIKNIVNDLTQDREITNLLFLRNDFFNLKLALKEIYREREAGDAYSSLGLISPVTIYQEAKNPAESKELPPPLKEAGIAAASAYEEGKNPADIDLVIDAFMYRYIIDVVKEARFLFLYKLFTMEVDIINIQTFFRIRWIEGPQSVFNRGFIEEGGISREFFIDLYPREFEGIETSFSNTEYQDMVGDGIPYLKSDGSFFRLEALSDNELLRIIRKTKLLNFGIEILVAYYYLKQIEIRKLRTVILGKDSGLDAQDLKLRLGYV